MKIAVKLGMNVLETHNPEHTGAFAMTDMDKYTKPIYDGHYAAVKKLDAKASECCDLLVCPFCGGEPELDTSRYYKPIVGSDVHKSVSVYCTSETGCPAEMMFCYADFPDFTVEQLADLAKEFWNKRVKTANPAFCGSRGNVKLVKCR